MCVGADAKHETHLLRIIDTIVACGDISDADAKLICKAIEDGLRARDLLHSNGAQFEIFAEQVPPVDGGKDLHNLARLVPPSLHEFWAPPSHVAHTIKIENIKDPTMRSYWEQMQQKLPKEPKHSITEFGRSSCLACPAMLPKVSCAWRSVRDKARFASARRSTTHWESGVGRCRAEAAAKPV